ncbi:unnamed protein product, partial [Effrenium voratum]
MAIARWMLPVLALGSALPPAASLPAQMLALVAASSASFGLRNFSLPRPGDLRRKFHLGSSTRCEVLLQVFASSVNPADRSVSGPFPQVMGSDLAAEVLAVEATCKRLRVGDRVWADIGAIVNGSFGSGKENGAYAQVAVALESQLGLLPPNLEVLEAAALPK